MAAARGCCVGAQGVEFQREERNQAAWPERDSLQTILGKSQQRAREPAQDREIEKEGGRWAGGRVSERASELLSSLCGI